MKKKIIYLLFLLILLSSCGRVKITSDKFKEGYGYTSDVKIIVYGNKVNNEYFVKQYVASASRFRIDCLAPDYIKGSMIILKNDKWKVSHSKIKLDYDFSKLLEADNYLVLGIIDSNFISNKNFKRSYVNIDNRAYEVLNYSYNLNTYRELVNLYIDKESSIPFKMEMVDINGTKRIEFIYNNFVFIKSFDENTFEVK